MSRTATTAGLTRAASRLGVDVAVVRAVMAVEAAGEGFLPDGRPKILFERHKFSSLTNQRFDATHPSLSAPKAGGYSGGAAEYLRLYQAVQLDGISAVQAASWGAFQIMGFNWRACGEKSVMGFVLAMHNSADAQLALFCEFVIGQGLDKALRAKDWQAFARGYNGPAYAINKYDVKLAAAYTAARA